MTNFNIEIKNLKKFKKALRNSPTIAKKELKLALTESVINWQRESGIRTPVDTGTLRRGVISMGSVRVEKTKAIISPNVEYALYVHEGTSKMRKRPFFQWGLDSAKSKIQKIFTKRINNVLKEIANKTNF